MLAITVFSWICLLSLNPQPEASVDFTIGLASEYLNDALGMVVNPRTRPATEDDYKRLVCRIISTDDLHKLPLRSPSRVPDKKISGYREVRMLFYLNDVIPVGVVGENLDIQRKQTESYLGVYYLDEAGGLLTIFGKDQQFDSGECAHFQPTKHE